jgi:methylmalonyl-CoA/ethylmalonyl-CoA epimerase
MDQPNTDSNPAPVTPQGGSGAGGAAAGQPPSPPPTALPFLREGVAQVGFVVPDLDAAVESWWRMFGVGPWQFFTYQPPLLKSMSYHGKPTEYRMRIALSWIGPLRIELIQPLEGDTVYADFVRDHGYGIHHFGILTKDMKASLAQARAAGIAMTMDGAGFGKDGDGHYAYLDTEAALQTTIELIERPAGRVPPEKEYPPR